jgi:hypothetical protein
MSGSSQPVIAMTSRRHHDPPVHPGETVDVFQDPMSSPSAAGPWIAVVSLDPHGGIASMQVPLT